MIVKETDSAPERRLWPATTDLMAEVIFRARVNRIGTRWARSMRYRNYRG